MIRYRQYYPDVTYFGKSFLQNSLTRAFEKHKFTSFILKALYWKLILVGLHRELDVYEYTPNGIRVNIRAKGQRDAFWLQKSYPDEQNE